MSKNELIDKLLRAGFGDRYNDGEYWFTRASDNKEFVVSFNSKDQMAISLREPYLGCRTKSQKTTDYFIVPNIFGPAKD
jgi:hypothetical protein